MKSTFSELKSPSLNVYSDPDTNEIHIKGIEVGMFRIYNPSLNLIKTGNLTKGLIDMSSVKKGVLFIRNSR